MGCVQEAVLEFDEEVRAPWRPRLVADVPVSREVSRPVVAALPSRASSRSSSRVGVYHLPVPEAYASAPVRRGAAAGSTPRPSAAPARTANSRPAARPDARHDRSVRRSRSGRVRLTRRARRLAVVLALAAGVALGSWLGPLLSGSGSDLRLAGESTVVVQPGDTLWSIAVPVSRGADVRAVVDEIRQLNGLRGADLVPGQVLQLP
jgi:nucleoid-associated protein YgaU